MGTFEERLRESLSHAYEIEHELGGGGMSRVFVATDRVLGRKIVIKLLSPELIAEVNRGRFRREIQVAAQLQHPHIVTLLSAGEDGDLVYYTMPFIPGESLKSALEKNGPLSVGDVIRILYDVVDALAYAHAQGVVHRDIKPANILRSGAHALVTDFGVAKALNAAMPKSGMTSTGMAIGTPAYMSPEQLAGDPLADHRIDIYAVGLLAYELLVGKSPFAALTPQAVLGAVLTRDPTPLSQVRKNVPRKLSAIVMQCLSKNPDDRPPSAEALLVALDMIATASGEIRTREHKVPAGAKTGSVGVPTPVPIPVYDDDPPKRGRGKILVGGIAVALLALAGAFLWSQRVSAKPAADATQATKAAFAESAPASSTPVAAGAPAPVAPTPVMVIDSAAIDEAVRRRLAEVIATKPAGQPAVNVEQMRQRVQREVTDSIMRANAARVAAAPPVVPTAPTSAPSAGAALALPVGSSSESSSGKKRIAITDPKPVRDQPAINAFSRAFVDALRGALEQGDAFSPVDQDSVRDAVGRSQSRDEAARILKPDVMLSPSYAGSGDTVSIIVTVWDMRRNSSYGIRVTSTKLVPSKPELYLGPIVQSVMKQLEDLSRETTIYRK